MRTAIVYTSRNGSTGKIVRLIRDGVPDGAELFDLGRGEAPDPALFDRFIIGGPVYVGSADRRLREYCTANEARLAEKPVGLFLTGLLEQEIPSVMDSTFPASLRNHARATAWFGGEIEITKHNFFVKLLLKGIMKTSDSVHALRPDEVPHFIEALTSGDR